MKLLIAIVALFAMAACGSHASVSAPEASGKPGIVERPAVLVKTQPLQRSPLHGTISANGQVIADAGGQASLAFATDGQIASIVVNVGDRVSRGQVLASLDNRLALSAIREAEANVAVANANLAKVEAGTRPQGNSAQVQAALAKEQAAKAELDRQRALAKAGIASQRDLEQARSDYESASADLSVAQQGGIVALASVQQAQAALSAAQTKASLLSLVAPFDGMVSQRFKNPGETVDPTIPVLAIVNPNRTIIEVQVSPDQAAMIRIGNPASMSIDGVAGKIAGRVQAVNGVLGQETHTMTVRIQPDAALTPGAAAKAVIAVRTIPSAFVVPVGALVKDPETGSPLLFVVERKGQYRRVPVQVLLESGDSVAVSAPDLRLGSPIVTEGAYELLQFAGGASGD